MNQARSNKCRQCGAKIVWCLTKNEKWIPVDMISLPEDDKALLIDRWREGDNTPLRFNPEKHISHFATCTKPERFRGHGTVNKGE